MSNAARFPGAPPTMVIVPGASGCENATRCLFCRTTVFLNKEPRKECAKLSQLIQNLCVVLNLDGTQLPPKGTRAQFPFCTDCDEIVHKLYSFQQKLEETIESLEQKVRETEIAGNGLTPLPMEGFKCMKLYEMVLEGYRNKLFLKFLRDNKHFDEENQSSFDPNSLDLDEDSSQQMSREPSPTPSGERGLEEDEDEELNGVDPLDFLDLEIGGFSPMVIQNEDDENETPFVISNVQSLAGDGGAASTQNVADQNIRVELKGAGDMQPHPIFRCGPCDLTFLTSSGLTRHTKKTHRDAKKTPKFPRKNGRGASNKMTKTAIPTRKAAPLATNTTIEGQGSRTLTKSGTRKAIPSTSAASQLGAEPQSIGAAVVPSRTRDGRFTTVKTEGIRMLVEDSGDEELKDNSIS